MAHLVPIGRLKKYDAKSYRYKDQRYPTVKVRVSPNDIEDIIDREYNNLFDQWRKLTDEILSELIEGYEIGEAALLEKAANPIQVSSVR